MRTLILRNTYTKALEPFAPLENDGTVTVYTCGPTVYSFAHIGNFRSFLFADVLCRVLRQHGYAVRQVMNITAVGQDDAGEMEVIPLAVSWLKNPAFRRCCGSILHQAGDPSLS